MFSQGEEEKIILEYFKKEKSFSLTFLDIGANDGVTYSNTRQLALNDWSGCLLEPSPKAYALLEDNCRFSKDLRAFNFGISDKLAQLEFHDSGDWVDAPAGPSLLSTLHPENKERFYGMNWEVIKCNFVTFDFFLSLSPFRKFDFISIDVEGHEMVILKQMDLKSLRCRLICLEYAGDESRLLEFTQYCEKFDMRELWRNDDNVIFCSN
jgi:FkbM family methyltransferase